MHIAKLSSDKIVMYLKGPQRVLFDTREYVLVSNVLSDNPRRIDPYWIPSTLVVWNINFNKEEETEMGADGS